VDLSRPLPFGPGSFDIVFSHLSLHYFPLVRTRELFEEIFTLLKPGGIFATLANTVDDPEIKRSEPIEPDYYLTPSGIPKRFFSIDSMGKFTSGFETLLLDAHGQTHKDQINTLIRFVGRKPLK